MKPTIILPTIIDPNMNKDDIQVLVQIPTTQSSYMTVTSLKSKIQNLQSQISQTQALIDQISTQVSAAIISATPVSNNVITP